MQKLFKYLPGVIVSEGPPDALASRIVPSGDNSLLEITRDVICSAALASHGA